MNRLERTYIIERSGLDSLFKSLALCGYRIIGPTMRDSAIVYDELTDPAELPVGWGDEQTNGKYRLKRRNDNAVFGWNAGPQSWKKFLFQPFQRIFSAHRSSDGLDLPNSKKPHAQESTPPAYAFFGVRPCELSAIRIQDRIFLEGQYTDPYYKKNRAGAFIVAVNCGQAGGTCFCTSMDTGPAAKEGYDLALTEVIKDGRHYFIVETGTEKGMDQLAKIEYNRATEEDLSTLDSILKNTEKEMGRTLDTAGLKEILYQNPEHPRWEKTAERCLSCANCTMVCPTCFCFSVEDTTDLSGKQAERIRRWDSCFTLDFSYIHGGSVRASVKSRYRQWLTHKLASWVDQFGTFGCVGCGRCITWCPVGIDITEEAQAIRERQI